MSTIRIRAWLAVPVLIVAIGLFKLAVWHGGGVLTFALGEFGRVFHNLAARIDGRRAGA